MTTIWNGGTNGGANRFFTKDGELMVAGQGVAGKQKADLDLVADLWGADVKATGSFSGPVSASSIKVSAVMKDAVDPVTGEKLRDENGNKIREETGDYKVTIQGGGVNGRFEFIFDDDWYGGLSAKKLEGTGRFEGKGLLENSGIVTDGEMSNKNEGAAMNFALFLEDLLETDAIGLIEDAGAKVDIGNQEPGGGEIRNLEDAIGNTFKADQDIKPTDDGFEVEFAGRGVGGTASTDPFATQAAAKNFIETVKSVDENGYFDDVLGA